MTDETSGGAAPMTGGCLCGALRWEARGEPQYAGYCCCADCRKASGSGFIGFMGFAADQLSLAGDSISYRSRAFRGGDSVRNSCPVCNALVFGGERGKSESFTVYVGSLDDPARFVPAMAIFNRDRPDWVILPEGLTVFETMPG